ncbi:hypothetical protein Tco_1558338 [Tanacetum coccineum]
MQADRQHQRDPNKDRRRAADKYRFNREVLTEVDEEQTRQTTADKSGRCIAQNHINTEMNDSSRHIRQAHSTESHKYGDEGEQTAADSDKQQQI